METSSGWSTSTASAACMTARFQMQRNDQFVNRFERHCLHQLVEVLQFDTACGLVVFKGLRYRDDPFQFCCGRRQHPSTPGIWNVLRGLLLV